MLLEFVIRNNEKQKTRSVFKIRGQVFFLIVSNMTHAMWVLQLEVNHKTQIGRLGVGGGDV